MAYDNTNTGALWVQTEKTSEKAPDLKGKINIDGVDHDFVGWKKFTAKGEMYSLVKAKPREDKPAAKTAPAPKGDDYEDSIPW